MATVLLLEDEPLIAMDLEYELREVGFDVAIVATCSDAIDWLEVCRPDVVIVDIVLRDGPCHAVVEQLVADKIPFIVHSGDHPSMHENTPFAHGTWVSKPAEGAELVRVARELVPGS
jgi:DNA-binding response OmpR family regulator